MGWLQISPKGYRPAGGLNKIWMAWDKAKLAVDIRFKNAEEMEHFMSIFSEITKTNFEVAEKDHQ